MSHNITKIAVTALLVLACAAGHAETGDTNTAIPDGIDREYWSVQYENDFFARSGDRYYTHGSQISRLVVGDEPGWLKALASAFSGQQYEGPINGTNYTIGQKIFTPNDTISTDIVENERPYAGYTFFSAALLSQDSSTATYDSGRLFEFSLGIVGPSSMAEEMQTTFHDSIDIDGPGGWHNQLHNELGLGLTYSRLWRYVKPVYDSFEIGINPQTTLTLGNVYTYAAIGAMIRMGTQLRHDFGPPMVRPGFPGIPGFRKSSGLRWYVFVGGEARLMGRNIFLDGNSFRDSHSVEKESLVADYQYGLVLHQGHVRIAITNIYRTREYTTQKHRSHYGALNISFAI